MQKKRLLVVSLSHFWVDSYATMLTPVLPLVIKRLDLSLTWHWSVASRPLDSVLISEDIVLLENEDGGSPDAALRADGNHRNRTNDPVIAQMCWRPEP